MDDLHEILYLIVYVKLSNLDRDLCPISFDLSYQRIHAIGYLLDILVVDQDAGGANDLWQRR